MNPTRKTEKKRILCIADRPDWIFSRHIASLQRYLSDEFEIDVAFRGQAYEENDYDLIYPLEFMLVEGRGIENPQKYITGIRSFISWADWDFLSLTAYLCANFGRVHTVSKELRDIFAPYIPGVDYMTHGVDMQLFSPNQPPDSPAGRLRLGWAGNRNTYIKGYWQYIQPLSQLPGVELVICGFADRNLPLEQMPDFYNSIDAYVCASSFEGSNNSLLEAAAMERAIVTTPVGTVPEYLKDHESALIVDRDAEQFTKAVLELRDNPELRLELGKRARQSLIEKSWDWRSKAEGYRAFFRGALRDSTLPGRPYEKREPPVVSDSQHLASVLQTQNTLLRELRIGDGIRIYDLEEGVRLAMAEIQEIRTSETYLLMERIKANKVAQTLIDLYQRFRK